MGPLRATSATGFLIFTLLLAETIYMSAAEKATVVSTIPIFPQIPSNQGRNDFQVLISVEAPLNEPRVPVHLIFVCSVNSDKLLTEVKTAIEFISGQLLSRGREAHDLLSIVGPSDGKEPVVDTLSDPTEAKEKTKNLFKARTEGTTFEDLLQEAIDIGPGREGAGVIVVLTDGSQGLNDNVVELVGRCNYPVHTIGLGANHDPPAMRRIASASTGGTYSFVDDANVDKVSAALAVCVAGLKNVVVPGTSVLKLEAAGGVKIKKIQYGVATITESAEIKIGLLHAGETKKILVHLDVEAEGNKEPEAKDTGCGEKTLLTVSLFRSSSDFAPIHKRTVCVERLKGLPAVQAAPSPLVLQQMVTFEFLQIIVALSNSATSVENLVNQLEIKWSSFLQVYQYWTGIEVLLGSLQQEIAAMKVYLSSYSYSSLWVAYINSYISSYEAQRPTAMGSSSNVVSVFITQEVNIMVEVAIQIYNNIIVHYGGRCPEKNCFDAHELAELIMEALREKKLHGKPCNQINADLASFALPY